MGLMKPKEFRETYFRNGNAPSEQTLRNWVIEGIVAGRVVNTGRRIQVWIDAEAWEARTGNPLADKVLMARNNARAAAITGQRRRRRRTSALSRPGGA
ncbi:hypothetical protein JN531_012520 [Flagellatimonas centrodinii]|uniref:hypothetical protein n=1 Tax=Flagellatimonas centrodinii TaxID=2806210 RepID=UPI001FEE0EBE|nr:hypothetical protein [Flagellatimonas centrodinii]ULQ45923.1 hypothetical protein JN531_012520 [Flagellatimonas centrodinii]